MESISTKHDEKVVEISLGGIVFSLVRRRKDLLAMIRSTLGGGRDGRYFVAVNPEKVMHGRNNDAVVAALHQSEGNFADGVGLVVASTLILGQSVERVTGIDLFEEILTILDEEGGSVFLFGAEEEVNRGCAEAVQLWWPRLRVVGRRNGYAVREEELTREINRAAPDFVAVALGSPAQEKWILEHSSRLEVRLLMGVGGTFDVISGRAKRAPKWVRTVGFEWAHRLIGSPSRLFRMARVFSFAWLVFREWIWSKK